MLLQTIEILHIAASFHPLFWFSPSNTSIFLETPPLFQNILGFVQNILVLPTRKRGLPTKKRGLQTKFFGYKKTIFGLTSEKKVFPKKVMG